MAEIKDFTCRACGAQFDTREKLDQHNRREHGAGQQAQGSQQGGGQTGQSDQQSSQQRSQGSDTSWDEEEG